jgi:hypothetical protein
MSSAGSEASGAAARVGAARGQAASLPRYGPIGVMGRSGSPGTVAATAAIGSADFNGDGLVDVVMARALGGPPVGAQDTFPIGVLLNDGKGRLREEPGRIFDGAVPRNQWGRMLLVEDFNNDGRPDVFLPDTGPEALNYGPPPGYHDTLILSTPAGRLRDATAQIPQQAAYTHSAAAADVDRDGDIDLFVGNIGGDLAGSGSCCDVQIWLNDGTGRFAIAADRLPPRLGTVNVYLSSGFVDANGDGAPDLALAGGHGCSLGGRTFESPQQLLLNDGRGFFRVLPGALPAKPFGITGEGQAVDVADLDRDGRDDLLFSYTSARQLSPTDCGNAPVRGRAIQVLMSNGDGTFRDETATRLPQPTLHDDSLDYIISLDLADLDGDDRPEIFTQLVIPPPGDPAFAAAYRNTGSGAFTALPNGYPVALKRTNVHTLVDLDGDGHRDLFIVGWAPGGDSLLSRRQQGKPVRPGTPVHVRVTRDPTTSQVVVAWPYVWGANRYEVWRSGKRIAVTKRMRYVDPTGTEGSSYTIRASNAGGTSTQSAPVVARG